MQLLSVGLNYQTAPLALRERVAVSGPSLDTALSLLSARVPEGFILSTCNRTELYALVGHADSGAELLRSILHGLTPGLNPTEISDLDAHLYIHAHHAAVKHLFLVAAGVQSMVPGEDQILAQLKDALDRADALKTLGPIMHRLGASALAVGKRVRAETGISRHSLSVVSVALQRATEQLGTLANTNITVIGAGQTAELALKHLTKLPEPPATITVVSRTAERSTSLAAQFDVDVTPWQALEHAIASADLVLSCTSAPNVVLSADLVACAMQHRPTTPLFLFDLAVPRDIEASAADIPNVTLLDIDQLQEICAENRRRRTAEIERAEALADVDVNRFMSWWSARQVAPTITALMAQAEAIREAEISRTLSRLTHITERDEELIRALVGRVVNKLLHRPVLTLKQDPEGANMAHVVRHLFGLSPETGSAALTNPSQDDIAYTPAAYAELPHTTTQATSAPQHEITVPDTHGCPRTHS